MPRYKDYSYSQGQLIPVSFSKQIFPGSFEYTLNYLIDNELDLSIFDKRFKNEEMGAPAYDPRILLKIILCAYSKGITSSRDIEDCCKNSVLFMALSANTRPHFTTIAEFISSMDKEIVELFVQVLLICDQQKLIGKEMFAIDGCKMPSNASKQWSGTRSDFKKKVAKMEKAIRRILKKHREADAVQTEADSKEKELQYIETLKKQAAKIKDWLNNNDDKEGKGGKPIKSNITDNESAKMKSSKGYIQGYVGVASVDKKAQVIVNAEAFGQGQEQDLLEPSIEGIRKNLEAIGHEGDVFKETKLSADAGFHNEENMKFVFTQGIDAYIADKEFRKRDPRFADYDRYKERDQKELRRKRKTKKVFGIEEFRFAEDFSYCICPAGERLNRNGDKVKIRESEAIRFKGRVSICVECKQRKQCLRKPEKTKIRQVRYFTGRSWKGDLTFTEKMKRKIDTAAGRALYSMRLAVAEPPFANITSALGLDRFTMRGKKKVNVQWNLYCIVHNLLKIHRYGEGIC